MFTQEGEPLVIKISKKSKFGEWNDYAMHTIIYEEIRRHDVDVLVPKCYFFVPADDAEFFQKNQDLIRAARDVCDIPTDMLVSERIPSLDEDTKNALINQYCAPRLRMRELSDPRNDHCLVKIYLGSVEGKTGERPFSLRNFELHLNQMEEVGLDVDRIASAVGQALAVLHWAANVDGWGVQFVLGGSSNLILARNLGLSSTSSAANACYGCSISTRSNPSPWMSLAFLGQLTRPCSAIFFFPSATRGALSRNAPGTSFATSMLRLQTLSCNTKTKRYSNCHMVSSTE